MAVPRPRVDVARLVDHPWLVALAVLVVGHLALILTRSYQPGGDWAFIELRTSDVFSRRPPLTGAWSRYGWNHPGPVLYAVLAVPRLLLGGSWRGLWIGAMALNVAAIVAALWLVGRQGRLLVAAFAAALWWTTAAATPHLFTDPWNASVVILPLITMAAAVLGVRSGDRRGVAVALVLFVAVGQTHAAYGVALFPAAAVVLVVGLRQWRGFTLRWLGVAALICLPVLVDTLANWPGNLWQALRFTMRSDEPVTGVGETVRVLGRATSLTFLGEARLPTFVGNVADTPWGVFPFAGALALAGAYVIAKRSGWHPWARAIEAVTLLWLGAALMTWRTSGPLLIWLTTWTVALVAITWCVAAGVVVRWLLARRRERIVVVHRSAIGALAIVAVTVPLAVVNVTGSVGHGYPFQELTPVVRQFGRDGADLMREPIAVDLAGDAYVAGAVQSGLVARMEQEGFRPLGRPDQALQLGGRRVASSLDGRRLLVQVEPRTSVPADATVVSTWDPLAAAERAEADALMDELGTLLDDAGLSDRRELLDSDLAGLAAVDGPATLTDRRTAFERLGTLHARGPRIVLYLIEP